MSDFTFIDLFAGIGGFHAALEALGGRCTYAAEIDDDARAVYEAAWISGREKFPFARDINDDVPPLDAEGRPLGPIRNVPDEFDVLAAGFPCQAFSKSGHQHGVLDRVRGTLFYNILRITAERKPKIVFLENVRNLAGPKHKETTFRTIIESLRDLGYLVNETPTIISPHRILGSDGGSPQIRERVYILAIREDLTSVKLPFPGFRFDPSVEWKIDETPLDDRAPAVITDKWLESLGDRARAEELRALRGADARNLYVGEAAWLAPLKALIAEAVRIGVAGGRLADADGTPKAGVSLFPGHPIWLRVHERLWRAQQLADANTHDQPWKTEFVEKSVAFLKEHEEALTASGALDAFLALDHNSWKKIEWQANDARSLDECLIQLRPSGIRIKKASYAPALVAINQTPILGSEMRKLSPYEAGRLQSFPDRVFKAMQAVQAGSDRPAESWDRAFYKQFGNAVHVGAVTFALKQFLAYHFPEDVPADEALRALVMSCRKPKSEAQGGPTLQNIAA